MIIWILENTREHQFKTSVNVRAVLGSNRRYLTISYFFQQNVCHIYGAPGRDSQGIKSPSLSKSPTSP